MALYSINIEYTSNSDKSGHAYLINEHTKVKQDLGHVVLPSDLHEYKEVLAMKGKNEYFIPNDSEVLKQKFNKELDFFGDSSIVFKTNLGFSLRIVGNLRGSDELTGVDQNIISMSPKSFYKLQSFLKSGNELMLEGKSKWFKFGLKPVVRVNEFWLNNFMERLDSENKKILNDSKQDEIRNKVEIKSNTGFKENPKASFKEVKPSGEKKVEKKQENKRQSGNIYKSNVNSFSNTGTNINTNQGLSTFDVMYMNAFPEMAPFHRPDSLLAWMLWFNNLNEKKYDGHVEYPQNNLGHTYKLRDVNVNDEKKYEVDIYDENNKKIGKMEYNPEEGLTVIDKNLNSSTLNRLDDGYEIETRGANGSTVNGNLENTKDGFIGDFTVNPVNAIPVNSKMDFSYEDLGVSSGSVNKIDDIVRDVFSANMDGGSSKPDVGISNVYSAEPTSFLGGSGMSVGLDMSNEFKTKYGVEESYEPPPPPPPPPPKDDMNFSSSDPYSYSSGGPSF